MALPLLVRGRVPVLDAVGALVWAAALITALRLLAGPSGEPNGLVVATLLLGIAAILLVRHLRPRPALPAGAEPAATETAVR